MKTPRTKTTYNCYIIILLFKFKHKTIFMNFNYKSFIVMASIISVAITNLSAQNCNSGALGWAAVESIFSSNGCVGCHNSTSTVGGLDLTSYQTFANGGIKCGSNITLGTTLTDIITIDAYAGCRTSLTGQSMNDRVLGAMDSLEILKLQRWVTAGVPEICQDFCIINEFISITLSNATYHFNVNVSLTANNTIDNGSNINYEAGDSITLTNGFSVDTSSNFFAFIGECGF